VVEHATAPKGGPLTAGPSDQPNPARAPWGHSSAAHFLFGFCAQCKGRTWAAEVGAWREWAVLRGVMAMPGAADSRARILANHGATER
jgi:hypothetical protein